MSDIVFMDTETLGLELDSPIWEFAAIRRFEDGHEEQLHLFIQHWATPWLEGFPEEFAHDHRERFDHDAAISRLEAAHRISDLFVGRPHVVGAVPNFDTEKIGHQLLRPNRIPDPWHYYLIDVENLVVGYLAGKGELMPPPWKSDSLSAAVGIDPNQFDRHTAMGDVLWVRAQYDAVMGGAL